jgi:hypothetical protein
VDECKPLDEGAYPLRQRLRQLGAPFDNAEAVASGMGGAMSTLYAYRSVARAFPPPPAARGEHRADGSGSQEAGAYTRSHFRST